VIACTYSAKSAMPFRKIDQDRDVLLAFYNFPAEHWKHVRTTNLSRTPSPPSAIEPEEPKDASVAKPTSP
jgi:hypothetical protein